MARVLARIERLWAMRQYENVKVVFEVEQDISDERLIAECKKQNATSAEVLAKLEGIQFDELHKQVLALQEEVLSASDYRDTVEREAVGVISKPIPPRRKII